MGVDTSTLMESNKQPGTINKAFCGAFLWNTNAEVRVHVRILGNPSIKMVADEVSTPVISYGYANRTRYNSYQYIFKYSHYNRLIVVEPNL